MKLWINRKNIKGNGHILD